MLLNQLNGSDGQTGTDNSALRNIVLAAMINEAPVLNYLQFFQMTGNSDKLTKNADAVGGAMRTLNNDYTVVTSDIDEADITLRIMGGTVRTDMSLERRGFTAGSERARQLEEFSRGLGRYLTDQVINGDGNSPNISGIKTLCVSGQKVTYHGADGGQVLRGSDNSAKSSQQEFVEAIDDLISRVAGTPTMLLMNAKAIARITSIMREYIQVQTITDAMGVTFRSVTYNNIPIVDAGYNKAKSALVIPNTETVGESDDCTSIYAVKCGEKVDYTCATSVGVVVKDRGLSGGVHYVTAVDLDINATLQNDLAIARLEGIRLP